MQWPTQNIPTNFLTLSSRLLAERNVSKQDFLRLCKIAVHAIDTGQVPLDARSGMALYIAQLWLNNKHIAEDELLNEIGGTFAELEIPGSFVIEGEPYKRRWETLKTWIDRAGST